MSRRNVYRRAGSVLSELIKEDQATNSDQQESSNEEKDVGWLSDSHLSESENESETPEESDASDGSDDDENDISTSIDEDILHFCILSNLSRNMTQLLLNILNKHGINVPKTPHQLHKNRKQTNVISQIRVAGARSSFSDMAYLSVKDNLSFLFDNGLLSIANNRNAIRVNVSVNIDGIPLYRSSPLALWPILVDFNGIGLPLPVAIFCGSEKPDDNCEFLFHIMV